MRVLIACGGSGGHIYPALAFAEEVRRTYPRADILFVTSARRIDRRIFEQRSCRIRRVAAVPLPDRWGWRSALFPLCACWAVVEACALVRAEQPDAIVAFGGYLAAFYAVAARLCRRPCIVHEQNVAPGRANLVASRLASVVAVSFAQTRARFPSARRIVVTGLPIRRAVYTAHDHDRVRSQWGLVPGCFTVLVVGGSQGARFLNDLIRQVCLLAKERNEGGLQMIHITGSADREAMELFYRQEGIRAVVCDFFDPFPLLYGLADVVLSRAGASTLFELSAYGSAACLVPYPFAGAHQEENARVFAEQEAVLWVRQEEATPERLWDMLHMFRDHGQRETFRRRIARAVMHDGAARLNALLSEVLSPADAPTRMT